MRTTHYQTSCSPFRRWVSIVAFVFATGIHSIAYSDEEKVFRTGLEADRASVAVSPDGKRILFDTNRLDQGLRLLNVNSGDVRIIPPKAGRTIGFPSWSPDGRHVAVVSAGLRDGSYNVDDMRIALLDTDSWQSHSIASGDGFKSSPFFSHDGKTVYYFKGKKRESGKTPANRYDLFAIELASGDEKRLTHEEIYQMGKGDDDGLKILFNAFGSKRFPSKGPFFGFEQTALFLLDKSTGAIEPLKVDQSSGIFDFYRPQRDRRGNFYFITTKSVPRERFHWYLARADKDGNNPVLLTELPISMSFAIARNTGDIYVSDKDAKELIIRKLAIKAMN